MDERTDKQLLVDYSAGDSQGAFGELVRRHLDFVYSAAARMVVDRHLAEDVTQAVFIALARQAGALRDRTVLAGWLHRTTQNVAAKTVRSEVRRRAREQEAVTMQMNATEPLWEQIAPHLDIALGELDEADRDALLLRYFERKSAREIGLQLGVGEEAAQKRLTRALERLRDIFVKRGLAVPVTSLSGAIMLQAVQGAPAGLAAAVLSSVSSTAVVGTAATWTIFKLMASTQIKVAIASLLTVGVASTLVLQRRENQSLHSELAQLRAELAASTAAPAPLPAAASSAEAPSDETLRLRGEVARLRTQAAELARLKAENERLRAHTAAPARQGQLSGEDFLAANAKQEGVIQTPSGLQYKVLASGAGRTPKLTDSVKVHYQGTLPDGTVFDSSLDRGQAAEFPVRGVIAGWTEALQMMKEGDKWQLFLPAKLAYGDRAAGGGKIAPNSTLLFEVELLEITTKEN